MLPAFMRWEILYGSWAVIHKQNACIRPEILAAGGGQGISGPARIVLEGLGFQKLTVVTHAGH
jgi:hypothetical protein